MAGSGGHGFARGDNAVAHCERCGFKYKRNELVYDGQYPDLLVCIPCWDPKHPQDFLPAMSDPVSLRDPRSDADTSAIAAGYTDVKWPPVAGLPGSVGSAGGGSGEAGGGGVYTQPAYILGLKFVLNVSPFTVYSGNDLEIPDPVGRIIAMSASTGTEKPVQIDSDDDITTWTPKTFDRNPDGSGQVGDRHGLANRSGVWVSVGEEVGGTGSAEIFYSTNDGFDWIPATSTAGAGEAARDVIFASGLYVCVGLGGYIETSPNGIDWTSRTSGISTDILAIAHDGTNFFACGESGVVRKSANGTSWSAVGAVVGGGTDLHGVVSSGDGTRLFVAAADGRVYYSDDDGDTWTANTGSAFGVALNDVAVSGTTVIAIGASDDVYLSADNGVSFTILTGTSLGFNSSATFACAVHDSALVPYGFIIGGNNGSDESYIATSTDGSTWTVRVEDGITDSNILSLMGEDSNLFTLSL